MAKTCYVTLNIKTFIVRSLLEEHQWTGRICEYANISITKISFIIPSFVNMSTKYYLKLKISKGEHEREVWSK